MKTYKIMKDGVTYMVVKNTKNKWVIRKWEVSKDGIPSFTDLKSFDTDKEALAFLDSIIKKQKGGIQNETRNKTSN